MKKHENQFISYFRLNVQLEEIKKEPNGNFICIPKMAKLGLEDP